MSPKSSEMRLLPQEAAARLIGFYPTITASDPEIYAAGLVHLFSRYPEHLVAEAVDPAIGLPSLHDFPPTMKQVKEFLEPKFQQELRIADGERRRRQQRLPAPDPVVDPKIVEGFRKLSEHLKRGFGPSTQ